WSRGSGSTSRPAARPKPRPPAASVQVPIGLRGFLVLDSDRRRVVVEHAPAPALQDEEVRAGDAGASDALDTGDHPGFTQQGGLLPLQTIRGESGLPKMARQLASTGP